MDTDPSGGLEECWLTWAGREGRAAGQGGEGREGQGRGKGRELAGPERPRKTNPKHTKFPPPPNGRGFGVLITTD